MHSAPRGPRPLSGEFSSQHLRPPVRKTSNSDARGFLSRKLSRQQQPQTPDHRPLQQDAGNARNSFASAEARGKGKEKEIEVDETVVEEPFVQPQFPFKSVVPDQLAELPSWYTKDIETAAVSAAQFRTKYPIHNPRGPRWYRNRHLAPPSREKRPPSVFSPSFPPMATGQERSQDSTKMPGPSRTPSGSPLHTPSSSQVRIHDVRVRTRKLSNTAHDNVDMMDVTDPWGTNWHHQSPYDLGSSDASEPPIIHRPRRLSMTHGPRHRTMAPSPLSQSTSAVHLASEPLTTGRLPRRLSKRRKPFRGLFSSDSPSDTWRIGSSAPVTPVEFGQALGRKISKTGSFIAASIAPSINSQTPTEKRAKRGSVLGRLARRFSVLKRSDTTRSASNGISSSRVSVDMTYDKSAGLPYSVERRSVSPQKRPQESPPRRSKTDVPRRRVPIPSQAQADGSSVKSPEPETQSMASVEEPITQGKLTVANPDDSFNSEDTQQTDPPSSTSFDRSPIDGHRILDDDLRDSPPPMDSLHHIPHAPLSIISEGETYLSSPKAPPALTPQLVSMSPLTIPSVPSLPLRKPVPSELVLTSPPPVQQASASRPPRFEHSLPPTPEGSRAPSPSQAKSAERSLPTAQIHIAQPLTSPSLPSIRGSSLAYAENTPLSRVSMIVNPPTPQPPVTAALPNLPSPRLSVTLPAVVSSSLSGASSPQEQPQWQKASSGEPSPTKKDKDGNQRTRSRRTETFKLVRTSSGHVQTVGGVVDAEGEHWQVVESPKDDIPKKRHERSKTSDSDNLRPREGRKGEKESMSEDSDQYRKHEVRRKSYREPNSSEMAVKITSLPREGSPEAYAHRPTPPEKPDRRRSTRETREAQSAVVRSTQTPVIYGPPATAKQKVYNGAPSGNMQRHVSTSTRPSSELNSVADLNTLKAADAWEIERLWKGRSMVYGTEETALPGTRHHITSDSRPSTIMSADLHRASSIPSIEHVSTVGTNQKQAIYQAPHNTAPRASSVQALYPSIMQQITPTKEDRRHRSRSMNDSVALPKSPPQFSTRSNPLPEPPRLSSYKPSPIPTSLAGNGDTPTSSEYWMKLAGVTVSH
ncbi:hypothetical protein BDY19DRAFT_915950 [Irpex rosettiformis]|uniref:Uncharacterized protein n=1 Tax=Irpex rosettiformis TaxID=378272 RepID=A0ACB8ULM1_9APHY|nr:hypothetical protein BDY19DRAFT_915950 [Irpex rosettiformis]